MKVERDHKNQSERANSLEKERCMLTEKIKALKAKIEFTEEENTAMKSKEQKTAACQTEHEDDDVSRVTSLTVQTQFLTRTPFSSCSIYSIDFQS